MLAKFRKAAKQDCKKCQENTEADNQLQELLDIQTQRAHLAYIKELMFVGFLASIIIAIIVYSTTQNL